MTPFGLKVRKLRADRGVTQGDMAASLGVSAAYLSALEHGNRGAPSWAMVQKIIGYFNVIWDEAEELQRLALQSHPRVVIDTAELPASATQLANLLAREIGSLSESEIDQLIRQIENARKDNDPETD